MGERVEGGNVDFKFLGNLVLDVIVPIVLEPKGKSLEGRIYFPIKSLFNNVNSGEVASIDPYISLKGLNTLSLIPLKGKNLGSLDFSHDVIRKREIFHQVAERKQD